MDDRARSILLRTQSSLKKQGHRDYGLCPKCKGECTITQLKYKLVKKIVERFPDWPVVYTYMEWEDIAGGKGVVKEGRREIVVEGLE